MPDKKTRDIFFDGAIPPAFIAESIQKHESQVQIGGHSIFLGQIRGDDINGKRITAIEYSAYKPMALARMDELREAIFAKFPLTCLHVHHSLGRVKTGELCFFVFASAAHRRAAIEACTEIVDLIKTELPIWGKEYFEDDSFRWKKNT